MDNTETKANPQRGDQTFLKNHNIRKVMRQLRERGALSRVELAAQSGLDKKTITNIVNELMAKGRVVAVARVSGSAGRPKELLAINGAHRHSIGIDLGGTHISGVLVDFCGKVVQDYTVDLNSDMGAELLFRLCHHTVDSLLLKAGMSGGDLAGIGVSVPGFVGQASGGSISAENLARWENVPVCDAFREKYACPVYLDDCSRAMALAELWFGAGRDCGNFIVVDLGLGIGCGIVLNGRVYPGATGKSGGIGHTIVDVEGPPCTCGRRGCIEALASGWALPLRAQKLLNGGAQTLLRGIVQPGAARPSTKDIAMAANLGDGACIRLLEEAGEYIGIGIANAIGFYNPARVVIGGRLVKDNGLLTAQIERTIRQQTIPGIYADTQIVLSALGVLSSAIGAAALCLEPFFDTGLA